MEKEKINIKCPKCSQLLTIQKPAKPGMYQLTCSKCNHQFRLQLRGLPIRTEAPQNSIETSQNQKRVKILGEPKLLSDGKYHINEPAIINHPYGCVCPKCQKALIFLPQQAGAFAVKCDRCTTNVFFKAISPEMKPEAKTPPTPKKEEVAENIKEPIKEDTSSQSSSVTQPSRQRGSKTLGMLSWGNIFNRKKHILYEGKTIIGRQDPETPSDIEIKDKKISRRSIEIDITQNEGGYFFKLTVKKAGNPVYVNYKELNEGESIYLKYGDVIQLGQTLINFTRIK